MIIPIIGEARELRPDTSIKNANDDVRGIMRIGPEARPIMEAQEVWSMGCVDLVGPVRDNREDSWVAAELGCLGLRKVGREAR